MHSTARWASGRMREILEMAKLEGVGMSLYGVNSG